MKTPEVSGSDKPRSGVPNEQGNDAMSESNTQPPTTPDPTFAPMSGEMVEWLVASMTAKIEKMRAQRDQAEATERTMAAIAEVKK